MHLPTDEEIETERLAGLIFLTLADKDEPEGLKRGMLRMIEKEHGHIHALDVRDEYCPEVWL